jgi:hypothetical protein
MVLLILTQLVLPFPLSLNLFLWLCIYVAIVFPYIVRSWIRRWYVAKHSVARSILRSDREAVWRARRWFAIGLSVVILHLPQSLGFAVAFPWMNHVAKYYYYQVGMVGETYPAHRYFGPFPLTITNVVLDGVYIEFCECRFLYSGDHPMRGSTERYTPIFWRWYIRTDDWFD